MLFWMMLQLGRVRPAISQRRMRRRRAAFSLAENDPAPRATEPLARGFVDIDRACGILEAAFVTA
jgi:hypothetical protein